MAAATVDVMRTWTPRPEHHAFVESVDIAEIDGEVGVQLLWTQVTYDRGTRRFGLLLTTSSLLAHCRHEPDAARHLEILVEDLRLAVVEPQATSAQAHVRTWWRDFP